MRILEIEQNLLYFFQEGTLYKKMKARYDKIEHKVQGRFQKKNVIIFFIYTIFIVLYHY